MGVVSDRASPQCRRDARPPSSPSGHSLQEQAFILDLVHSGERANWLPPDAPRPGSEECASYAHWLMVLEDWRASNHTRLARGGGDRGPPWHR